MIAQLAQRLRSDALLLGRSVLRRPRAALLDGVRLVELGEPGEDCFFGYHDVTPFGPDDGCILAMRRSAGRSVKTAGTPVELGVFDLPDGSFRPLASSTAWCWQQGCRLQWLPGETGTNVLFNRTRNGRHETAILDATAGREVGSVARPTYSLSPDGRHGLSLNFSRLQRLRPGYGYDDLPDPTADDSAPADDGLWLTAFDTGESVLLISLAEIAAHLPQPSMNGAVHYFNHILWSPDGAHVFFLHLWRLPNGSRRMRAFVCEVGGQRTLTLLEDTHASHHCWVDESRLIIYSTRAETGMCYHLYDIRNGAVHPIGVDVLVEDGHPSMSPVDGSLMVTDTYPDRMGEQHLLLFNLTTGNAALVGRFYSPPAFRGEVRCDLHPRWSRNGTMLCVDSAHCGERRLCVVDLGQDLGKFIRSG